MEKKKKTKGGDIGDEKLEEQKPFGPMGKWWERGETFWGRGKHVGGLKEVAKSRGRSG